MNETIRPLGESVLRRFDLAVWIDVNPPSLRRMDLETTTGHRSRYLLLNFQGHLVFRFAELVGEIKVVPWQAGLREL